MTIFISHLIRVLLLAFLTQVTPVMAQINFEELGNPATNFADSSSLIGNLLGGPTGKPGLIALSLVFAGLILFAMIVYGGFTMLTNATNPSGQEKGKNTITYAIAGFVVIFSAYWVAQILEVMFGLNIV